MSESFLKIESVSKSFGNTKALDNVSLDINKSELFSLLGSSGCGKSTLLRIIAGFEKPDSGKIYLDGEDITSLPPYLRPLNIMFQNYALFPHLNVKKNIEFGLKEENLENNENVTLIGSSNVTKYQIFRYQNHAYGIQFHIEIKDTTVNEWGCVPEYKSALEQQLGKGALEKFDKSAQENMTDMNKYSQILYKNFKKLAQ